MFPLLTTENVVEIVAYLCDAVYHDYYIGTGNVEASCIIVNIRETNLAC